MTLVIDRHWSWKEWGQFGYIEDLWYSWMSWASGITVEISSMKDDLLFFLSKRKISPDHRSNNWSWRSTLEDDLWRDLTRSRVSIEQANFPWPLPWRRAPFEIELNPVSNSINWVNRCNLTEVEKRKTMTRNSSHSARTSVTTTIDHFEINHGVRSWVDWSLCFPSNLIDRKIIRTLPLLSFFHTSFLENLFHLEFIEISRAHPLDINFQLDW